MKTKRELSDEVVDHIQWEIENALRGDNLIYKSVVNSLKESLQEREEELIEEIEQLEEDELFQIKLIPEISLKQVRAFRQRIDFLLGDVI